MKKYIRPAFHGLLAIAILGTLTGCKNIETRDGVTIEKQSGNSLKFW